MADRHRHVLLAGVLALASCSGPASMVLREQSVNAMGTSLEIAAYSDDPATCDRAIAAAIAEFRRVEDLMTDWRPSPMETLNASAGKGPQKVPEELAQILGRGQAVGELTRGAFDITFASVGRLWKFKEAEQKVPSLTAIREALTHVGYDRLTVAPANGTVTLPLNMRIGLGGIAKGYGVDRAMAVLMRHGIKSAVVNAGGDMKVLGLKDGRPWEIAIKHPRERDHAIAVFRVSNTCVVTSGDYERFFVREGKRYHHILDPRTGHPATGCISATVIGPNAEYADALATTLCVLGPDAGLALIEQLPRIEAIVVDLDGHVRASTGCRSSLVR